MHMCSIRSHEKLGKFTYKQFVHVIKLHLCCRDDGFEILRIYLDKKKLFSIFQHSWYYINSIHCSHNDEAGITCEKQSTTNKKNVNKK